MEAQVQAFIPFKPVIGGAMADNNMLDPKERFFRHFQAEIITIQDRLEDLAALSPVGGERQDCIDTILTGISRLTTEVMDAGDYIPSYDQRTYSQAIKGLTEKLNETRGKFAPKSRFQFKQRASQSTTAPANSSADPRSHVSFPELDSASAARTTTAIEASEDDDALGTLPSFAKNYNDEIAKTETRGVRKPSFSTAKNIAIHGHEGLHIILPATASRATTSGSLTNLSRCIVDMAIPTSTGTPFAGLALKNIQRSLIIVGHVAGPAHITGVEDSVIVVAARQVRIHECKNVQVYLHCASHPIIEDCEGMLFAPIPDFYMKDAKSTSPNQWDQVDDFKWLKSEPSPNWSVLAEEKRITEDEWKNTVCGSPSLSTDDILRTVGVLNS